MLRSMPRRWATITNTGDRCVSTETGGVVGQQWQQQDATRGFEKQWHRSDMVCPWAAVDGKHTFWDTCRNKPEKANLCFS